MALVRLAPPRLRGQPPWSGQRTVADPQARPGSRVRRMQRRRLLGSRGGEGVPVAATRRREEVDRREEARGLGGGFDAAQGVLQTDTLLWVEGCVGCG